MNKGKKLDCQEEFYFLIIKIKEQEEKVNVEDDEEISLQNDEHDDSIDLDGVN